MSSRPYRRGDSPYWWIAFRDERGRRRQESTGTTDLAKAEKLLADVQREAARRRELLGVPAVPVTLGQYLDAHERQRKGAGVLSARKDAQRIRNHAPELLEVPMTKVRREHLVEWAAKLRASGVPPRTLRHAYGALRVLFDEARVQGVRPDTPCTLTVKRRELPALEDADPTWRDGAVFDAEEMTALLSDERIPADRRLLYGLIFLGAMRIGEALDRRWTDLQAAKPLWALNITTSWSTERKEAGPVKTRTARRMPVHPVLQAMLEAAPRTGELICPKPDGSHRSATYQLEVFHDDCRRLGIRPRRQHDARRTFISLAQADGARGDILYWVTHGKKGDIMGAYTTLPWAARCAEVAKLKVPGCYAAATEVDNVQETRLKKLGRRGTRSLTEGVSGERPGTEIGALGDRSREGRHIAGPTRSSVAARRPYRRPSIRTWQPVEVQP